MNKKGFAPIAVLVVGLIVLALGMGVRSFLVQKKASLGNGAVTSESVATNSNPAPANTVPSEVIPAGTSDWETYTDNQYGFELMYPKDWLLLKSPKDFQLDVSWMKPMFGLLPITSPKFLRMGVEIHKTSPRIGVQQIKNQVTLSQEAGYKDKGGPGEVKSVGAVQIGGKTGQQIIVHWEKGGTDAMFYNFVSIGTSTYQIDWGSSYDGSDKDIFTRILSTFRFIAPTTTPSVR